MSMSSGSLDDEVLGRAFGTAGRVIDGGVPNARGAKRKIKTFLLLGLLVLVAGMVAFLLFVPRQPEPSPAIKDMLAKAVTAIPVQVESEGGTNETNPLPAVVDPKGVVHVNSDVSGTPTPAPESVLKVSASPEDVVMEKRIGELDSKTEGLEKRIESLERSILALLGQLKNSTTRRPVEISKSSTVRPSHRQAQNFIPNDEQVTDGVAERTAEGLPIAVMTMEQLGVTELLNDGIIIGKSGDFAVNGDHVRVLGGRKLIRVDPESNLIVTDSKIYKVLR
jgi:hypothetical protein